MPEEDRASAAETTIALKSGGKNLAATRPMTR
jgi:hypothetical protein